MTPATFVRSARLPALRRLLFVVGMTALIVACKGDSATNPTESAPGIYSLATVNGKALPFRMYADTGFSVDIAESSITLKTDSSFLATLRVEERVQGHLSVYADSGKGRWVLSGTSITFTAPDSTKQVGTLNGRNITLVDSAGPQPLTYVYSKR